MKRGLELVHVITKMSVSSDYVNYLIWRYLQESGRALSALALDKETQVSELDLELSETARGELVRLLIKGTQMCQVESASQQSQPANNQELTPATTCHGGTCAASCSKLLAVGTDRAALIGSTELDSNSQVTCLAWNGAKILAVGAFSGQLRVWTPEGTLLRALNLHTAPLSVLEWNRSSTHLLSADTNGTVAVWEGSALVSQAPVPGILCATWIDARTFAISAGRDIAVHKLDLSHPHTQFHGHSSPVSCLAFDHNSQLLASGADDGTINAWHGRSATPIRSLNGQGSVCALQWMPSPYASAVTAADPTITSKLLAGYSNRVVCWDVDTSTELWSIDVEQPLMFISRKDTLVAVASSTTLRVYRTSSTHPQLIGEYLAKKPVTALLWEEKFLVLVTASKTVLFDFEDDVSE